LFYRWTLGESAVIVKVIIAVVVLVLERCPGLDGSDLVVAQFAIVKELDPVIGSIRAQIIHRFLFGCVR
jgi:hypothetical protein